MCAHLFLGFHRFRLALRIFSNRLTSPQYSSHYRIAYDHYHHRYTIGECQKDDIVAKTCKRGKNENKQFAISNPISQRAAERISFHIRIQHREYAGGNL